MARTLALGPAGICGVDLVFGQMIRGDHTLKVSSELELRYGHLSYPLTCKQTHTPTVVRGGCKSHTSPKPPTPLPPSLGFSLFWDISERFYFQLIACDAFYEEGFAGELLE